MHMRRRSLYAHALLELQHILLSTAESFCIVADQEVSPFFSAHTLQVLLCIW